MERYILALAWALILSNFANFVQGKSLSGLRAPAHCGDWEPYKDVKCLKIATHAGHQTKENAEIVCQSLSEGLNQESFPRLMTVKTQEEQEFLQNFLFKKNSIVDNVWLGLGKIGNAKKFQWSDGTSVVYSNWANQNITDGRHECVQMASGEEITAAGLWVRVTCKKANVVVCERTQTWGMEVLQNMFMNYKLEQEQRFNASEEEIASLKLKVDTLKRNPVPIGFIYVELPGQQPPTTLWPQTTWRDVSAKYAGQFFRVMGGDSAPFGQIQEAASPRLAQVEYGHKQVGPQVSNPINVPLDGSWSPYVWDGTFDSINHLYLRFRLSKTEVRPRNQAVKVWQRIQ